MIPPERGIDLDRRSDVKVKVLCGWRAEVQDVIIAPVFLERDPVYPSRTEGVNDGIDISGRAVADIVTINSFDVRNVVRPCVEIHGFLPNGGLRAVYFVEIGGKSNLVSETARVFRKPLRGDLAGSDMRGASLVCG